MMTWYRARLARLNVWSGGVFVSLADDVARFAASETQTIGFPPLEFSGLSTQAALSLESHDNGTNDKNCGWITGKPVAMAYINSSIFAEYIANRKAFVANAIQSSNGKRTCYVASPTNWMQSIRFTSRRVLLNRARRRPSN